VKHITGCKIRGFDSGGLNMPAKGKGKAEVHHTTGHEGPEGKQGYSSTLSLTSAPDIGGHAVAHLLQSLRQKPERHGFYSPWCQFFSDTILPAALWS
jgi:hypothetical protein